MGVLFFTVSTIRHTLVERHQFLTVAISEEPRPQVGASSNEKASWDWGLTPLNPHMDHSSPCTARGILAFSHKLPEYVLSGRNDPLCLCIIQYLAPGAVLKHALHFPRPHL
jgi:hypothetical protein